jgi:hypothetical protein
MTTVKEQNKGLAETPRTDALARKHDSAHKDHAYRWHDYSDLARQLERELAALRNREPATEAVRDAALEAAPSSAKPIPGSEHE